MSGSRASRLQSDAHHRVLTEFATTVTAVEAKMESNFPEGSDKVRRFLAEEFVTQWLLVGIALPEHPDA